jgi:hypothetical protein
MTPNVRIGRAQSSAQDNVTIEATVMHVDRGHQAVIANLTEFVGSTAIDDGQLTKFQFRQSTQDGAAEHAARINPSLQRGD